MADIIITLRSNLTVSDDGDLFEDRACGDLATAQAEIATRLDRYQDANKRLSGRRHITGGPMDSVSVVNQYSGGSVTAAPWRKRDA